MTDLVSEVALGPLARKLRTGKQQPTEYLEALRRRFGEVEPDVEAFVSEDHRWERLIREVSALESSIPESSVRPPLFGVPIGIKDIFHVDGFETKAGSSVPRSAIGGPESPAVTALKRAGGLILGKTVTTEFAYFDPGPTRNPHDLEHTPGGSSSGSAAAVAAGLCPMALGTQTIGSVIRPAAFNGIVGVKPTYGRIPIQGVIPVAPSVDHVGFFTQDLEGATLTAGVLYSDWSAGDEPPPLETIGVVDGPYLAQASDTGREQFQSHVAGLDAAGYDIRRVDFLPEIDAINERHERLVAGEMALSHDEWYEAYEDHYAEETRSLIERGMAVDVGELCSFRNSRTRLRESIHERMDDREIDLVVSPSAPGPAPSGIESTGDPAMNLPWTHALLPTVSIPASRTDDGLPIGLQCTTHFGRDEWLLSWCREIESALEQ